MTERSSEEQNAENVRNMRSRYRFLFKILMKPWKIHEETGAEPQTGGSLDLQTDDQSSKIT